MLTKTPDSGNGAIVQQRPARGIAARASLDIRRRVRHQARARRRRDILPAAIGRLPPRAFTAAIALSLLVLLSPGLTLAPVDATRGVRVEPPVPTLGGPPHLAVPPTADPDPRFDAALDAARRLASADAASAAVMRDGALVWAGDSGTPEPYVIGSVTKTFVAATVLQLVAAGRLRLDQTVDDLLPVIRGVSRSITIRQLLDHTSGVADVFNQTTSRSLETEPDRAWSTRELMWTLHDAWHAPGAGWSYSNTNSYLLGMIVERVTGRALGDEIRERFLSPLALTDTRLLTVADPAPLTPAWATVFWGSGAMTSTAIDLATWGDALYGGKILGAGLLDEMLAFNADDYGLGAQRLEIGGVVGVGHTGLLDHYTTLLWHVPDEGLTIALLVDVPRAPLGTMLAAEPPGGRSLLELATGR